MRKKINKYKIYREKANYYNKISDNLLANCTLYFTALQYVNNIETKRSYKTTVSLKNLNFFYKFLANLLLNL